MPQTARASLRAEPGTAESAVEIARLPTVVVSVPGIAEKSLRATLESLPAVQIVGTAAGCLSAVQMVRDRQAGLVVLDSNLPWEEVRVFLQYIKAAGLGTCSLVLAAINVQVHQALAAGADAALRRDASIHQLDAAVAELCRAHPRKVHT
jgi:DNA-binding NarL/FixJ family response regulator